MGEITYSPLEKLRVLPDARPGPRSYAGSAPRNPSEEKPMNRSQTHPEVATRPLGNAIATTPIPEVSS